MRLGRKGRVGAGLKSIDELDISFSTWLYYIRGC